MPERVMQPAPNHEQDQNQAEETRAEELSASPANAQDNAADDKAPEAKVIWTPAFLLIFTLTLVLGLSAESLLAQGWSASLFHGEWIILTQVILGALGWLGLGSVTRSRWIRVGSVFGGLASIFMLLNIFLHLQIGRAHV